MQFLFVCYTVFLMRLTQRETGSELKKVLLRALWCDTVGSEGQGESMVGLSTAWGFWQMQASHVLSGICPETPPKRCLAAWGMWGDRVGGAWGMGHVSVFFLSMWVCLSCQCPLKLPSVGVSSVCRCFSPCHGLCPSCFSALST